MLLLLLFHVVVFHVYCGYTTTDAQEQEQQKYTITTGVMRKKRCNN